jgi:hypothetical protein
MMRKYWSLADAPPLLIISTIIIESSVEDDHLLVKKIPHQSPSQ